jgi:hypothetical protein
MSILNNRTIITAINQRLTALEKHVPKSKAEISINGQRMKVSEVHAFYTHCLDVRASLEAKRAELKATIAEAETAEAQRLEFDKGLRGWVANQFGPNTQVAFEFGFLPRKQPVKSVESKQHAVAQSKATRKARHTMGKKQRLSVVGVVASESPPSPSPSPLLSPPLPSPVANGSGPPVGAATAAPTNGSSSTGSSNGAATH